MAVSVSASSKVATAVAESDAGVSTAVSSVSTVSSVSSVAPQARISKSGITVSVEGISLSLSVGLSLPLGNVDGSNRVSPVVAGSSIAIGLVGSNGGGGSNSVVHTSVAVSSVHSVEGLGLTLAVVTTRVSESSVATEPGVSNAGISTAISKTISSVSTVATKARVAKAISMPIISVGLGLSLSSSKGRTAEQNSKPEHLPCL